MRDNQNGGTTKKEGQPKMRHNQKGGTIKILTIDMSTLLDMKKPTQYYQLPLGVYHIHTTAILWCVCGNASPNVVLYGLLHYHPQICYLLCFPSYLVVNMRGNQNPSYLPQNMRGNNVYYT